MRLLSSKSVVFFVLASMCISGNSIARVQHSVVEESKSNQTFLNNIEKSNQLNTSENSFKMPFVHRLYFDGSLIDAENKKKNVYLGALVPFYDQNINSQRNIMFLNPSVSLVDGRTIYNGGFGFRQLNAKHSFFWGVNLFYDFDSRGRNSRLSKGLEFGIPYVTLIGNIYEGYGDWNCVSESKWHEKVAGGHDAKIDLQLPFYPQVSFSTRYFSWSGKNIDFYGENKYADNPRGFKHSIEYKPIPLLGITLQQTIHQNQYPQHLKNNTALLVNIVYDPDRSFKEQTTFNWKKTTYSLSDKLSARIDRDNSFLFKKRYKHKESNSSLKEVLYIPPELKKQVNDDTGVSRGVVEGVTYDKYRPELISITDLGVTSARQNSQDSYYTAQSDSSTSNSPSISLNEDLLKRQGDNNNFQSKGGKHLPEEWMSATGSTGKTHFFSYPSYDSSQDSMGF